MNNLNTQIAGKGAQQKAARFIHIEMLEYVPGELPVKTIMSKHAAEVSVSTFISNDAFGKKVSADEIIVQVIDGLAELIIDENSRLITRGQSITIHTGEEYRIVDQVRFSMISTTLKESLTIA